jgi:release factor glutamine methyltransferase
MIRSIASQLQAVYPADEAEALAWWVVEESTGLSRSEILSGCKGTTNFPKVQEFCAKNGLCSHKNRILAENDGRSQENANVASGEFCKKAESEGTPNLQEIIDRLLHFEPIQYIFGHTLWNGLDLRLTPATLIPRPETAELVTQISNSQFPISNCRVLDIGTGSGCIAIALKKAHPEWQVTGIDISAEAIEVARENARRNGVEVDFQVADIFDFSKQNIKYQISNIKYNLIVSNPPYICEKEKAAMRPNVLDYEPASALFVPDSDPLLFYRRIASLCSPQASALTPRFLFFEINEAYPSELYAMLEAMGYTDILITHDSYGKPRFIQARSAR